MQVPALEMLAVVERMNTLETADDMERRQAESSGIMLGHKGEVHLLFQYVRAFGFIRLNEFPR